MTNNLLADRRAPLAMQESPQREQAQPALINRLGQRLGFERMGIRLYDRLIRKCETGMDEGTAGILRVDKLQTFRSEERDHALMVASVIEELGADPSVVTPDATICMLASSGLPKVINDPGTTVLQCLEAIQIAELTDNVAWENLQELCMSMGLNSISARFSKAISQERVHQQVISEWVKQLVLQKAKG